MIFLVFLIYVYLDSVNKNKEYNTTLYFFIRSIRCRITIALPSVDWVESASNILRAESIATAFRRSALIDCAVELLDELI